MTTHLNPSVLFNNGTSDQQTRDWITALSAAFQGVGLVQTTDTGQINKTTVVRGGTANADIILGYEIFRFNDALQGTAPIFVKVEYGFVHEWNANYGNYLYYSSPLVWITVGTGTNNAGTLTGIVSTRMRWFGVTQRRDFSDGDSSTRTAVISQTLPIHACMVAGGFQMFIGGHGNAQPQSTNMGNTSRGPRYWPTPLALGIERTHDLAGNDTADGVVIFGMNHSADWYDRVNQNPTIHHQTLVFNNAPYAVQPVQTWPPIASPGEQWSSQSFGGDAYFFPMMVAAPTPRAQMLGWLGTYRNDVTLQSEHVVTVLGSPHRYIAFAGVGFFANGDNQGSRYHSVVPSSALLMRWE